MNFQKYNQLFLFGVAFFFGVLAFVTQSGPNLFTSFCLLLAGVFLHNLILPRLPFRGSWDTLVTLVATMSFITLSYLTRGQYNGLSPELFIGALLNCSLFTLSFVCLTRLYVASRVYLGL